MNGLTKMAFMCLGFASLIACHATEPPAVAPPSAQVTDDDREVIRVVIEHLSWHLRERSANQFRRDQRSPSLLPTVRFLVFDATIESCRGAPRANRGTLPGCLGQRDLSYLNRLPLGASRADRAQLLSRNVRSLPIHGASGENVVYMPSALVNDQRSLERFVNAHAPPRTVVAFSAPIYPRQNTAIIFYRHFGLSGGFIQLARVGAKWSHEMTTGWIA